MLEGEEKLIESAKRGESLSFSALYDHYLPPIYRFVYLKVSNREMTVDLTHEVFLSAWQNLASYKSQGFPFSSWLYQIARNKVIDHYRLQRDHSTLEEVDSNFIKAEFALEAYIDQEITLEGVKEAIRQLTSDQQDVLIMKFIEDLSHEEIARVLEKSEGAVRLIQHRALKELKKMFGSDV